MNDSATVNPRSSKRPFVYTVAVIAALGGLLFGYDTGVISGAILYIEDSFHLGTTGQSMVVSSVLIGAIFGAAFGGSLADRLGRRKVLLYASVLFAVGALGSAASPSDAVLILSRIVIGLAIGAASFAAPLYIAEVSPVERRGGLVSLNQLAITIGILVSYFVDYGFSHIDGWRWMLGLAIVPAAALGFGMLRMPESPRWMISRGFKDRARETLAKIRERSDNEAEISDIERSLAEEKGTWKEALSPMIRPALAIGIILAFIQQMTGINTVIYYAPTIFRFAGFHSDSAAILATVGVGVVNVGMTVVSIMLIDKIGRKPLLYMGLTGMVIALAFLGFAFEHDTLSTSISVISVICLMVYIASFAISLGPIFWLINAEIYPLKVRAKCSSLGVVANWVANFIVAVSFLHLIDGLGKAGTFWLFGSVGILAIFYIIAKVPETKGRSLEEIEADLLGGKSPTG